LRHRFFFGGQRSFSIWVFSRFTIAYRDS